jgi:hypothetical protein
MSKFSSLRTSAAGSYLGLYVLSAFTTGMFVCVLLYHYFTESLYFDQYSNGDLPYIYTTITWVCMGWLMCLIAGIGFDILPLIHGTTPFHENAMRQFLITNLAGQGVLAISTFMNTEQKILEFATVGISFLCLSILLLGGPGRRMFKESKRRKEEDEVGIASLIPGVAFPFFGATILACWLYRDIAGMLELGRSIMIMFFLLLTVVIIISHFNRRLNWEVIAPQQIGLRIGVLLLLMGLHILFVFLAGREATTDDTLIVDVRRAALGLALIWGFLLCNPLRITRMAFQNGGMAHSRPIFAALWMLPFCGFHAYSSDPSLLNPAVPGYASFLGTSGLLSIWGYAWYLHEDHLHISIHKRKANLPFLTSFIVCFLAIQMLYWDLRNGNENSFFYQRIWAAATLCGTMVLAFNFVRITLFSLEAWHKIPMFYGRYIQEKSLE